MFSHSCSNTHQWCTASKPILYKNPLMRLYVAALMAKIGFFFMHIPSGASPFSKNCAIFSNSARTTSIRNKCVFDKSSSNPIGSSPLSIRDKWSGPTFNFPGMTMTLNSNSWNRSSHRQILPWCKGLFTRYFSAWWLV